MDNQVKNIIAFDGIDYVNIPCAPMYYISKHGRVLSTYKGKHLLIKPRTNKYGYLFFNLVVENKKKFFYVHALMRYTYFTNAQRDEARPYSMHVNHIDGNKTNNELSNLELVSMEENQRHYQIKNNPLGIGVTYHKRVKRYQAQIGVNNKRIHIGYYTTPNDAAAAYMDMFVLMGISDRYVECTTEYKQAKERAAAR